MTSTNALVAATCSFVLDDDTLRYAQKQAFTLVPRRTQTTVALVGGVVGSAILGEVAKSEFFDHLMTPAGEYELAVSEHGLVFSNIFNQRATLEWVDIESWGADKRVFIAQDVRGKRVVLPRTAIPEHIFSMIVEICSIAAKRAKRKVGKSRYGKWSQLGTGEKIVRGFIYTVGVLVLLLALPILLFAG